MNDLFVDNGLSAPVGLPSAQTLLEHARARAYARLNRGADFPILIVCAPNGYGKSTVVREFFSSYGRDHRRLHIAKNHTDMLGVVRALADCLSDLVPALLTSAISVHGGMHQAQGAPRDIAAWAAGHLEPIDVTFIIDGLSKVTDDRLFALLTELVDQTANTRMRWVFVLETAERFPVARWLANGRMDLPLDEFDLALNFEDLLAAVEKTDAPLASTTLRSICAASSNWPASIALALSDVDALGDIASAAVQPASYRYFATRAFDARADNERRFLLETCLYRHFDSRLLHEAGWPDVGDMLERLYQAGAILFSNGDGIYRYHEQFRTFVEQRLRESPNELHTNVSSTSALVCRRVGRWADALELYTNLRSAVPLAELLSEHGFELLERGDADFVYRALDALSDADFAAFPVALAVKASLESLHGSFDVAEAWFRHAIKHVGNSSQRASIVFRFATDLVRQDRRDAIDILRPIVAEGGHDRNLSASLAGLLATAYATHQETTLAAETIERAIEQMAGVDDPVVIAKLYYQAGYVAFFARAPERAKSCAQQAVETALATHLYDIAARGLSILYNVAMDYEDDVAAGLRYLDQLTSCSLKAGSRHLLTYAVLAQFEIAVLRGDLTETARLDEALKSLEVDYSVLASETLLPAQALRATWVGDFHRAYRLIASTAETQITPTRQSQRFAEIAVYAAAAGLRAESNTALSRALAIALPGDASDKSGALTQAYVALALNLLGRHRRAADLLVKVRASTALTSRLAQLIAAIETINDRWSQGRYSADLRATLEALDACDFGGIGRLIEALPLPETFRGQFAQLSASEREVLIHMSAGLDPSEIASLSGQSSAAVAALIASLCRKLGCTGARHAVALATSAGGLDLDSNVR